jgi:hypothetical protein
VCKEVVTVYLISYSSISESTEENHKTVAPNRDSKKYLLNDSKTHCRSDNLLHFNVSYECKLMSNDFQGFIFIATEETDSLIELSPCSFHVPSPHNILFRHNIRMRTSILRLILRKPDR